jgi:hypothetical protein
MRKSVLLLCILMISGALYISAWASTAPPDTIHFEPNQTANGDTLEYELIIFDPHFNSWFLQNQRPMAFYEQSYLESWNVQLVSQWNHTLPSASLRSCAPTTYLDYRSNIDYGKELNYKLFYYFRYIHQQCRVFSDFPGPWR